MVARWVPVGNSDYQAARSCWVPETTVARWLSAMSIKFRSGLAQCVRLACGMVGAGAGLEWCLEIGMTIDRKHFLQRIVVYGLTLTILHGGLFLYCFAKDIHLGRLVWLFMEPGEFIYNLRFGVCPPTGDGLFLDWVLFWLNSMFWGFSIGTALAYLTTSLSHTSANFTERSGG